MKSAPDAPADYDAEDPPGPSWRAWLLASRPKTLLAAMVPVWAGTVLAQWLTGRMSLYLAAFTVLSAVCIQVATNFFNDAIDHAKGADTEKRLGPKRVSAEGLVPPQAVIMAGISLLFMAAAFAMPLIAARGWPILAIGVPSLYFSFGYTGGPLPLAYRGLGEIFVILFFGLIAVTGTVFVQTGAWHPEAVLLGVQVGFYATALIAINNLRDREEDASTGKRTLAVRCGEGFGKSEIGFLCLGPLGIGMLWLTWFDAPKLAYFPMAGLPLSAFLSLLVWKTKPGVVYNRYLGMAALQLFLFAVFFTLAVRF
jgi:1,4-dihydroxy-2-naphthoate octaprenyltransferase